MTVREKSYAMTTKNGTIFTDYNSPCVSCGTRLCYFRWSQYFLRENDESDLFRFGFSSLFGTFQYI